MWFGFPSTGARPYMGSSGNTWDLSCETSRSSARPASRRAISTSTTCTCWCRFPRRSPVSQVVGFIKGKSAIYIARTYLGRRQNFTGQQFWARGYYVSTVGRDEATIRAYIQRQEAEDQRLDQLDIFAR